MTYDYHPELNPDGYDGIELDAKMEEVDANTPDKELDDVLIELVVRTGKQPAAAPWDDPIKINFPLLDEAKHAILKHYISRAEVLEMIGEDEPDNWTDCEVHAMDDLKAKCTCGNKSRPRNQLRAELRQKLGSVQAKLSKEDE